MPEAPMMTLVVGDEELLAARAVSAVITGAQVSVGTADVREVSATGLQPGELSDVLAPTLFAEHRVVVVRDLSDATSELGAALTAYAVEPAPDISLVAVHGGGTKGQPLLQTLRAAGARVVECQKLKPADRPGFVADEVARAGGSISAEAIELLIDAVGTDLRELATACGQLVADAGSAIDVEVVTRYHRGRAEVSGFLVADRAVEREPAAALEALRWALAVGTAPVLVTSALAANVRAIGKVAGAGRRSSFSLAKSLGMAPWKVERAQRWARDWRPEELVQALYAVAEADEAVKGGGVDPAYALEKAVLTVSTGPAR
jgi:DNA polymerase-3 subunit delta